MSRYAPPSVSRRSDGSVIWPPLVDHAKRRLRAGKSLTAVACELGVSPSAIFQAAKRYALHSCPSDEMFVSVLRRECGVTEATIYARAGALGMTPKMWGQQRTVTLAQAAQLAAQHRTRPTITVEQMRREGWLSSKEAAQRLGITWRMFILRVLSYGLTAHRVSGVPGRMIRYDPAEVRSVPVPVAPKGKPRGFVTLRHLAELCECAPVTVQKWIQAGLPHVRDRVAFHAAYVRPAEVLAWLEGQPNPKRRRYAEALRLHLEQQRAA